MLFLRSPAKSLDFETPAPAVAHTQPLFVQQAALAFAGDVYDGLAAASLAADDLQWLQDHVCILSGLYGVLRPLDYLQPYRLEMGSPLANARGKDLYQFWAAQIADYLNQRLRRDASRRCWSIWPARSISRRWTSKRSRRAS